MERKLHLGIGHYGIGFQDGVNTVICRNVKALRTIDSQLKITLFGKLAPDYQEFIKAEAGRLEYLNIDEFHPASEMRSRVQKSITEQQVHDYMWQGTNLAEILDMKLREMDVILIENLGIGIDPSVTYAFYLYTQYCDRAHVGKRFIFRVHDFVQQRPHFFSNVKKFHERRFAVVPDWHSVLYPSFKNIQYIAINRYDRSRLIEHGIEEDLVFYIPNSVDKSIIPIDDRTDELKRIIIRREKLDPSTRFILYPVRCVRRKNVEEAIFFVCLLNSLANGQHKARNHGLVEGRYHLLVSLLPESEDDRIYCDQILSFVKKHALPVSIGFNDLVSLNREMNPNDPAVMSRYSIGDFVRVADLVITTSFLEGFGFAYLEPWILDRPVIGRSIPFVTPDFQAEGMKLGHLYTVLIVDERDFKEIGKGPNTDEAAALQCRLEAILKLKDPDFVNKVFERNETPIVATIRLFDPERRNSVVDINKKVVEAAYSQHIIGKKLHDVIVSA